jgi:hypothetical protein
MKWLNDIILHRLNKWHTYVHTHNDEMKIVDVNKKILSLSGENERLKKEVESLKLQVEIKQMNDFLQIERI